jgi:hypothetical protein
MTRRFYIPDFLAATGEEAPTEAERALLAAVAAGLLCQLSPGRPDPNDPAAPRIRADLLAHLITGGCDHVPVSAVGVRLIGAVITGPLILNFAESRGETDLRACHFTDPIAARRARLVQLVLSGSHVPGLLAEGARTEGSVFLLGLTATGRISFATAEIGGQLVLHGASITSLTAQGARIGASVYLRASDTAPFTATGEVSLSGAEVGGQVAFDGAVLSNPGKIALTVQGARIAGDVFLRDRGAHPFQAIGEVRLSGAQIGGQLDCATASFDNPGGHAFAGQRMQVGAEFFWQSVTVAAGDIYLPSAHVGDLVDDLASWPAGGRVYLDGFTYDRITRDAPVDARTRLDWLARCTMQDGRFLPQPYTQAAAVLARMGHEAEARRIMEEQARRKGRARRAARWAQGGPFALPLTGFDWLWDRAAQLVVGYGFQPFRSLLWLLGLSLIAAFLAAMAWDEGSMAPNNDLIAASDGWQALLAVDCIPEAAAGCVANPADLWNGPVGAGLDWESFHPLAYGADVVIPVLELGQTRSWSPSKDRGPWGHRLWWARWFLMAAGWVVTALGAAAATGIIQRATPTG